MVDGQLHFAHDSFEVFDGAPEIDAPHCFNHNGQFAPFGTCRDFQLFFAVAAVEFADVATVDEYLCVVLCIHRQQCRFVEFRQCRGIDYGAEALVVFLHRADVAVGLGRR